MALTVAVGVFVFERSFDVITGTVYDRINEGVSFKVILRELFLTSCWRKGFKWLTVRFFVLSLKRVVGYSVKFQYLT